MKSDSSNPARWALPTASGLVLEAAKAIASGRPMLHNPAVSDSTWGEAVHMAARHKMFPIFADAVIRSDNRTAIYEAQLYEVYIDAVNNNRRRMDTRIAVCEDVLRLLDWLGVRYIVRKGHVYDRLLYSGRGLRKSNDIDLYIDPSRTADVEREMRNLGFRHMYVNPFDGTAEVMDRGEYALIRLFPDHLPPFVRKIDDGVQYSVKVDFSLDLFWTTSGLTDIGRQIIGSAMDGAAFDEGGGQSVDPIWFHLVDCATHIYREAMFEKSAKTFRLRGVTLQKFLDFFLLSRAASEFDVARLRVILNRPELARILAWVVRHTETVFDEPIAAYWDIDLDPTEAGLDQIISKSGAVACWEGTMLERLFRYDDVYIFYPASSGD